MVFWCVRSNKAVVFIWHATNNPLRFTHVPLLQGPGKQRCAECLNAADKAEREAGAQCHVVDLLAVASIA